MIGVALEQVLIDPVQALPGYLCAPGVVKESIRAVERRELLPNNGWVEWHGGLLGIERNYG
jgi:hypothetical protein